MKEREKELEEELKDEERIDDNEHEPEESEFHGSKQSSSSESKEEAAPSKPKRPTLERKALASPVKVSYSLDKLFEYQWPPDIHGEFYYLEHHISEFVDDTSFSSKHKGKFKMKKYLCLYISAVIFSNKVMILHRFCITKV